MVEFTPRLSRPWQPANSPLKEGGAREITPFASKRMPCEFKEPVHIDLYVKKVRTRFVVPQTIKKPIP